MTASNETFLFLEPDPGGLEAGVAIFLPAFSSPDRKKGPGMLLTASSGPPLDKIPMTVIYTQGSCQRGVLLMCVGLLRSLDLGFQHGDVPWACGLWLGT